MENWVDYILIWVSVSVFINFFGFWINIKIPYYKGNWDINKKTPIYKLELSDWNDYYQVCKYEIKYVRYFVITDNIFHIFSFIFFIPFSCWFGFPQYEKRDVGYGNFIKEKLEDINFDIGKYYEKESKKAWNKYYKAPVAWLSCEASEHSTVN
jgi:hypothetical protein